MLVTVTSERGVSMGKKELRWLGIGGLVFVLLAVLATAMVPTPPSINADAAKLAAFYTKSKQGNFGSAGFITVATVVVGVFWFWYFREFVALTSRARRLATVAFAGALIFGVGGAVSAGLDFVLSDAAGKASPGTIEALHYLYTEGVLGLNASGVVVFLLATALVMIRVQVLPAWLGWVGLVLALVAFAITPLAVICAALWMIPANIILIARSRSESETSVMADA